MTEIIRYGGAGGGGTAVAGHHRATLGTEGAVGLDNPLQDVKTLVADTLQFGFDGYLVVHVYLAAKIDLDMHHHHREVTLLGMDTAVRKKAGFAQVKKLHNNGIVDMSHGVDIIEAQLDR